ncbi:hypothetical protein KSP40_PGU019966 [Platanthera guangdongensis]|uniref:Uncharacterized protein n=1 Tax=Platanthera guangdongensis TaxID=2320717 RepID=A0ABR2LFL8_9ASPA
MPEVQPKLTEHFLGFTTTAETLNSRVSMIDINMLITGHILIGYWVWICKSSELYYKIADVASSCFLPFPYFYPFNFTYHFLYSTKFHLSMAMAMAIDN